MVQPNRFRTILMAAHLLRPKTILLAGFDNLWARTPAGVSDPRHVDKILEVYIKTDDGVAQLSATGQVLARARTLAEMFGC